MIVISWNSRAKVLTGIEIHSHRRRSGSIHRGGIPRDARGSSHLAITRSTAINCAASDLKVQLAKMRKAGWERNIVIVGEGPVIINRISLPPVSSDEMPGAVSMALESAGLAAADVRPAWRILSRSKEAVQVLVAAWRSEGTDECLAAAVAAGFRVCCVPHAAFCLAAIAHELTTAENKWAAVIHDSTCELVLSGTDGVSYYRIITIAADNGNDGADAWANNTESILPYLVAEIKRTLLAQEIQGGQKKGSGAYTLGGQGGGVSASRGLVFGRDDALVNQAVELLNNAGLRAKQGRPWTVVPLQTREQGQVQAQQRDAGNDIVYDAGDFAALIGAALIASGKAKAEAEAGPDLLSACAAGVGIGNVAVMNQGASVSNGRPRPVQRSRAFLIPLILACLFGLCGALFSMLRTVKTSRHGQEWIIQNAQRYAIATQIMNEIEAAEKQVDLLSTLLSERRSYLDVLQGIAVVLPEGTKITSIVFKGDELVDLAGTAPQASKVLAALEGCGNFEDLRFRGSIMLLEQENTKTEQFHLSGKLLSAKRQVAP